MKSILYVGATLMIGASVYGFVDYKQTRSKQEFKEMYVEEPKSVPAVSKTDVPAPEPANVPSPVVKTKTLKKQISLKDPVTEPVVPVVAEDEDITAPEPLPIQPADEPMIEHQDNNENTDMEVKTSNEAGTEKKITKKKKFNTRMFSRAPLREEEEQPVKKDSKKKN